MKIQDLVQGVLLAVLAVLAAYSLGRGIMLFFTEIFSGVDFFPYWYQGHFFNQEMIAYRRLHGVAFVPDNSLLEPVYERWYAIPANTPPMILFLAPFALLSWPAANFAFFLMTMAIILATPWLAMRLLPEKGMLSLTQKWLVALAFYALLGVRNVIPTAQTTPLVILFMLITLVLPRRYWLLAGICFGIGLSKYSLGVSFFLLLLLQQRFRVILVGFLVQILSLFGLAALLQVSPWQIVIEQADIFVYILNNNEQLDAFNLSLATGGNTLVVAGIFTLIVLIILGGLFWRFMRRHPLRFSALLSPLEEIHLLSALTAWMLLVGYHRRYDTLLIIITLVGFAAFFSRSASGRWHRPEPWLLLAGSSFALMALILPAIPGRLLGFLAPEFSLSIWLIDFDNVIAVSQLIVLTLSLWMLVATRRQRTARSLPPATA